MAFPGENFVIRLLGADNPHNLIHMNVLDVAVAGVADTVALVEWAYGLTGAPVVHLAGFSVLRFDIHGNLLWQTSRTLCTFHNYECGQWEIDGHLARTSNGVLVAGTGTFFAGSNRRPLMFAVRLDEFGAILWTRLYAPPVTVANFGSIVSVAPMSTEDHFLIAANTYDDDAWLFAIDGTGKVVDAGIAPSLHVRRLRATPTQGIFAVGALSADDAGSFTHAAVLNLDPAKLAVRWLRNYFYGVESPLRGVHWLDIAEGDHSLLVVGNLESNKNELSPLMAFLETDAAGPKVGDVRTAFLPTYGVNPVRLRGVASFIEEIVPLAPGEHKARFAVTGDVQDLPWHFLIGEDGVVEWQKRYRTSAGFKGKLAPTRWPAFHHILAGGQIAMGTRSWGILVSSLAAYLPTTSTFCADGLPVDFPKQTLYQQHPSMASSLFRSKPKKATSTPGRCCR